MKKLRGKSRAQEIADELFEWIHSQSLAPGDRIPSVRQLTQQYRASQATILKALSLLSARNQVRRISTKGGYEKASPGEPRAEVFFSPQARSGPTVIADRLQNDIVEGIFAEHGMLPGMDYLGRQYGCSPMTMRRALKILTSRGALIEMPHSRYSTRSHVGHGSVSRIVIVSQLGFASVTSYQTRRLIEQLEQALPMLDRPSPVFLKAGNIYRYAERREPAGLVLLAGKKHEWIAPIEKHFPNVPIAIIDMTEEYKTRNKSARYRAVFYTDNFRSACKLGMHLRERGYRKAAFISNSDLVSDTAFSFRYEGLSKIIDTRPYIASSRPMEEEVTPGIPGDSAISEAVDDIVNLCKDKYSSSYQVYRPIVEGLHEFGRMMRRNSKLRPFFDRILQDEDCAVWVCADDEIALSACAYLRSKNIIMPSRRALACFGDTFDLFVNRVTTVNQGFDPLAHKVSHWLARPSLVHRNRDGRIAVVGNTIVRSTT